MRYLILAIMGVVLTGGIAYADGYAQTLDKAVGNYIANVDYDSFTPEIYAQIATSFSFQLWNKDRTETVPFSDVSVNIFEQNNPDAIFSGTLSGGFGQAGLKYKFENASAYTVQVRFHNEKYENLAEATFPLTVVTEKKFNIETLWTVLFGVIGFMLGCAVVYVYKRKSQ